MRNTHQAAAYGSDEEFLAMAVPFLEGGLAAGHPVLAVTTSANLELLRQAMGDRAHDIDYAESAYFGRRPPQRVAAFERYWRRHAAAGDRVRILAEPIWIGRSAQDIADWERMESGLNVLLAPTTIWMICPYDARVVDPAIVAGALRTHPENVTGDRVQPSPDYLDPHIFVRTRRTPPPEPPPDAVRLTGTEDLRRLRHFVAAQAAECELAAEQAAMLVMAVNETATYLNTTADGQVTVRMWVQPGAIVCDLRTPADPVDDPFPGYRTPRLEEPAAADGLWYAHQICDRMEIGPRESGSGARLHFPTPRAADYQ